MIDHILRAVLLCTQESVIIPAILIGLFWINRKLFYSAATLLVLNMLINHALKITFAVPLMPHLGKGFAFPSGHMSSAIVFYGFIAAKLKNPLLNVLTTLLLSGVAVGLVYFDYHTPLDLFGALLFGWLLIALYIKFFDDRSPFITLILPLLGAGLMLYMQGHENHIPKHIFMAEYLLIGFALLGFIAPKNLTSTGQRIVATALAFGLIFALQQLLPFLKGTPAYISQSPWLFVPLMIIAAERAAVRFLR